MGMGYCSPAGSSNRRRQVVESLYGALFRGDTAGVAALLAEDVDWCYHGPRRWQQHMMGRLLTGEASSSAFRFAPARVTAVGEWVLAEGRWGSGDDDDESCNYWVHAWMLPTHARQEEEEEKITGLREYYNTSLTVRDMGLGWAVWRSQPEPSRIKARRSMPALVLAI